MPKISDVTFQYAYFDIQLGFPDWKSLTILDFGGNVGNLLDGPGCEIDPGKYWCIDVDKIAIRAGRRRHPGANFLFYDRYNFSFNPEGKQGFPIPDPGVRFDLILAYSIFTHTPPEEMQATVQELLPFLNPGGRLAFTFIAGDYNAAQLLPGHWDICNFEKRLRNLNGGKVLPHLVDRFREKNPDWSILINQDDLYLETDQLRPYKLGEGKTYFTFLKPSFLQTLFPTAQIFLPPARVYPPDYIAEQQHLCVLGYVGRIEAEHNDAGKQHTSMKLDPIHGTEHSQGNPERALMADLNDIPPQTYSIGVYEGNTPFSLQPAPGTSNPVLSQYDFPEGKVKFVADPFFIREGEEWFLFFELMPLGSRRGKIALARSGDGINWSFDKIVLEEEFHLSYPYVFRWEGNYYMVPETYEIESVRLYMATGFPDRWTFVQELIHGMFVDASPFQYQGKWWLFACPEPKTFDSVHLYFADRLTGPWKSHPSNPIHKLDPERSRPAGRILVWQDRVFRFAQDCGKFYGEKVRAFEIKQLSVTSYEEMEITESPVLAGSGEGWNGLGMHHLDVQEIGNGKWRALVDGRMH